MRFRKLGDPGGKLDGARGQYLNAYLVLLSALAREFLARNRGFQFVFVTMLAQIATLFI